MKHVYCGWRFFKCPKCGMHWKETCRDYSTPSRDLCPRENCESHMNGGISPYQGLQDDTLRTDRGGNLLPQSQQLIILK
jgi:hypothetical protein